MKQEIDHSERSQYVEENRKMYISKKNRNSYFGGKKVELPKGMKQEIRRRCSILQGMGVKKEIASAFTVGNPFCSIMFRLENVYSDIWIPIDDHKQFRKIQADFEKNYGACVYLGIYSEEKEGAELAFLYVLEEDVKYWGKEREELKNHCPLAYIYNFAEKYDDIVPITITVRNGVLVRIEE